MGLYNFQERFVPKILSGEKRHTIRAERKHPDKPGNTVHLYVGLRRRGAALLMRSRCLRVEQIRIGRRPQIITIEGQQLSKDECEQFARCDGFDSFADMMEFWRGRLPFKGHIIHWEYPGKN